MLHYGKCRLFFSCLGFIGTDIRLFWAQLSSRVTVSRRLLILIHSVNRLKETFVCQSYTSNDVCTVLIC